MKNSGPNIVWFITDDTDFSMLHFTGGNVLTPNMDRVAAEGVVCTRFHAQTPVCTPSRFNYLTGLYAGNAPNIGRQFPEDEPYAITWNTVIEPPTPTFGSVFRAAGYTTGFVGKCHTGPSRTSFNAFRYNENDNPSDQAVREKLRKDYDGMRDYLRSTGFDYAEAVAWGNTDNRPLKALQYHNLEWHVGAALDFIDRNRRRPFALHLALTTIHGPCHMESIDSDGLACEYGFLDARPDVSAWMPPRSTIYPRLQKAGIARNHRTAGAMWMDDAFGAVMKKLEELGLYDNTIIICSTDHNILDGKATCCQGGVHIPFAMKWAGAIKSGSTCEAFVQNVDLLPTLCGALDVRPPAGIDGIDRWKQISGAAGEDREDLFFEFGYCRAVRTGKWKYIALRYPRKLLDDMQAGRVEKAYDHIGRFDMTLQIKRYPHFWDQDQLYDLAGDPGEQKNLAGDPQHAGILKGMQARLKKYLDRIGRPFDLADQPFLRTDAFRELAARTAADTAVYQSDWWKKGAY
ncbi:MAG: sulfatase-like hydrolase/transferase [Planctomycetes bacterium]|nr:sulfatase-like hydrolase/transferase [Planctomycetota bacterium]